MKLITTSKFYSDFSKWVSKHKFDEFGRPLKKNGTLLNGNLSSNGYPSTVITDNNGKARSVEIHRIVAILFLENPNNYTVVNHKNGNKCDFRITNLEWCSSSHNSSHAYKNNLREPPAKSIIALNSISGERKVFKSIKECATYFSIKGNTVSFYIRRGAKYKGWIFSYKEKQNTIQYDDFLKMISNNEVKEHPIYKGYFCSFCDSRIISTVKGLPRVLAIFKNDAGYSLCTLRKYNKTVQMHRFLYECYHGMVLSDTDVIDHIDSDRSNNAITNLNLTTNLKNIQKSLNKSIIVELNGSSIRFNSAEECSSHFGVSRSCVYNWLRGHRTSFVNYGITSIHH